ncbi:MAG: S9 family peptidase [Armatimonadetes bacterium]|nr:S9 family peptidase [Armatimonadota bacterium]
MAKRPITAADLLKIQFVSDPQMSPDGSRVLFVKTHVDKDKNKYVGNLFTVDVESGEVKQWTQGEKPGGMGRWSPDGSSIAFVAGRVDSSSQVFILPTEGGEARKLTSLPEGAIGEIKWSPDGLRIAFTFREVAEDRTSKASKERKEKGGSPPPWEIDELWYRMDEDGYFGGQRFKLYVVDVATGEHRMLYGKDKLGFYSFDWLPNSSGLAVAHSAHRKEPLLKKPNDQVYIVPLNGKVKMISGLAKGPKGNLKVSPDGKQVAFLGDHIQEEVWGMRNTRLYVAPMRGGGQRCLSERSDFCLATYTLSDTGAGGEGVLEWAPNGKSIFVMAGTEGTAQIGKVSVARGGVKLLTEGQHVLAPGSTSADGKMMALTRGTTTSPAEVAVFDGEEVRVLTDFNKQLLKDIEISKPVGTWVTSADGTKVHTWVMKPPRFKRGRKYPAVLEIHGGPHCQYGWAFFHEFQLLAAQGYVVVFSNPRGSKGYGEAFCEAIRRDWGNKDWADVEAVKDWMASRSYVNTKKMGVMGGSYGGFMTNWAIGHTNDFVGAITDRCVFNWTSMAGNSDFPLNRDDYFGGCAWGPLKNIEDLWRQSPCSSFDKVKTPTLVIHSEGDLRCNVEQAEQVFYVLKSIGVETRFVRYPANSSHGLSRNGPPDLRIHRLGEIVDWWKRWLQ